MRGRSREDPWTSFFEIARQDYEVALHSGDTQIAAIAAQRRDELIAAHRRGPGDPGDALMGLLVLGLGLAILGGGGDGAAGGSPTSAPDPGRVPGWGFSDDPVIDGLLMDGWMN